MQQGSRVAHHVMETNDGKTIKSQGWISMDEYQHTLRWSGGGDGKKQSPRRVVTVSWSSTMLGSIGSDQARPY